MAIVKIQGVKRIDNAVNYIKQNTKTNENLISTFDCSEFNIQESFNNMYEERFKKLRKKTNNKAKMVIQSFDSRDNITPEIAHEIGKKLADNYLKGNHKYIIATHIDTDNIHNHIIFNEVRNDNLLMFDTTRKNTVDNLRLENDKLSKEYNLTIPDKKKHENKIHYISQRELKVREKGNSFKENLENTIDEVVENSNSYEEFIKTMESLGYKNKEGKYLAFLNKKSNKFMRSKTLGMNYTRNSIKYRIENKDFKIHKFKYTVKTKKIDKTQGKFKNNYGLRKWATKQNIIHLQEISNLVFNEGKTLEEIENIQKTEIEFNEYITETLAEKDNTLIELDKMAGAFQDYKDSGSLIAEYKKSNNKKEFKRSNYQKFKKYDNAKKNMNLLKKNYGINNYEDLVEYRSDVIIDRNELFKQYTKLIKEKEQEQEIKERELENKKKRTHRIRR